MPEDGSRSFAGGGYLGVSESLTRRVWQGPSVEADRCAAQLVQQAGLTDPLARVLARMRVGPEEAEAYLAPTLRDSLPDPSRLRDADRAAARLNAAVAAGTPIAVFAEYDVDGAASAALLID